MAPRNRFIVPAQRTVKAEDPPLHHTFDPAYGTFFLRLEIEALSPLFTGAGFLTIEQGEAIKAPLERAGELILAGSSIKGACRQLHEVLTASSDPFRKVAEGASARLFGSLGHAGRLSFDDAVAAASRKRIRMSVPYPPKNEVKGRRFYGTLPAEADQPERITAQAFPAGARLSTLARLVNVTEEEVGGVLVALGMAPELAFTPRLGGGKYDTYGWVRLRVSGFRAWRQLGKCDPWEVQAAPIAAFVARRVQKFLEGGPPGLAVFREQVVARLQGPDRGGRP